VTQNTQTTIESAQEYLRGAHIDGWLLRDYFDANPIFWNVLGGHANNVTRPCWLFIPADGEPTLLAHGVDAGRFAELWDELGGTTAAVTPYSSRDSLVGELTSLLADSTTVAMEYSPEGALPRVGRTDAGSVELIRSLGVEVVSSGNVLQHATERWSPDQLDSHRYAAERLTTIVHNAFDFVSENINWKLTEHDLAEFIRGRFDRQGLTTTDGPAVAVNAHSSDPHYEPQAGGSAVLRRGNWLLIDLWARKENMADSMYADITWTAFLGDTPSPKHQQVFDAVISGRDAAVELIQSRVISGDPIEGWEADRQARDVISAAGFGDEFIHRLGHSLGRTVHSNAVNLDDWETHDTRNLAPGLGVTVEPGIYTGEFGVRSEIDLYIGDGAVEITTERQTEIHLIGV
jgi:Xaa-Pro aminopeptidase